MQKSLTQKLGMTVAAIAMAATGLFTATDAEAVPAFARQTGMTCNSCHFQSYPSLNGMGRSFKSGGYTMQGTQPFIEGEGISLPSTLNISVIWKYFWNGNADGGYNLTDQDEVALLIGGRVNASTGFLMENSGGFLSQKIHFNVTDNFAIIPFLTDAAGAGYGFELMNTGVNRPIRPIENRRAVNFSHVAGSGVTPATGVAFVYHDPSFFVNYTMFAATDGPGAGEVADASALATWIRGSYFFDLAGFDSAVGVGIRSGEWNMVDAGTGGGTVGLNTLGAMTFIDFQMQGDVGGKPLGFYFTQTTVTEDTANSIAAVSGIGFAVKYTAMEHFEVFLADSSGTNGTADAGKGSIGFEYLTSQNVKLLFANNTDKSAAAAAAGTDSVIQIGFEAAM